MEQLHRPLPEGNVGDLHYEFIFVKNQQFRLKLTGQGAVPGGRQPWHSCRNMFSEIWFEEGITEIGERAFVGYQNLNRIWLPSSLQAVGKYAFADCMKFEEIYYLGTSTQLDAVSIPAGALPERLFDLRG